MDIVPTRALAPRGILTGVYAGRLCVATALFVAAARVWATAPPQATFAVALMLLLAIGITAAAYWYTHQLGRWPGDAFLYGQILFDAVLVTGAVWLTGRAESDFAPLYVLVICAAALVTHRRGAAIAGALCCVLYLAVATVQNEGIYSLSVASTVVIFVAVALATGYLGERMRDAGQLLGQVQGELQRLRLDTDEILRSIGTGVLTVDGAGRLIYLNPAASETLRLDPERWLGEPVLAVLDRAAPNLGTGMARAASTGETTQRREITRADGTSLGYSTTIMGGGNLGGRPAVTAILQDITERKRAESLRRRAERLEAVATLSASLAHEIKNPLASIRSAAEQLAEGVLELDDREVLRRLVVRESERVSHLLSDFIDFARMRVRSRELVDLRTVVQQAAEMVRAHPEAAGVQIAVHAADEPVSLRGEPDLLHLAVTNLVLNAAQWAGSGGRVRVALGSLHSDALRPVLGTPEVIRLQVSDSGPGVAPEHADHVFDPFFTLRPGGKGLGLALVQRAVEAHGGAVMLDEPLLEGGWKSTFTVYLPSYGEAPETNLAPTVTLPAPEPEPTLL